MKKVLLFAVMACAILSGCKKETKEDPQNPEEPVVTSDSVDFQLRIYATMDQMKYSDYCAYIKLNGEENERKLVLNTPAACDTVIDKEFKEACDLVDSPNQKTTFDSSYVYSFNFRAKKGKQELRFEGKRNSVGGAPETMTALPACYCSTKDGKSTENGEYKVNKGISTNADSLNRWYNMFCAKVYSLTVK